MPDDNYQWVLDALDGVLPDQTLQFLQDHILARETPFQSTLRSLSSLFQRLLSQIYPVVAPLFARASSLLQDSPDVVFVLTLVGIAFAALQALLWAHRFVMFWTRLASRVVMWAVVFAAAAAIWQRGPEAVLRDLVVVVSKAVGYATILKNVWLSEYERYDAQTKNSRKVGGGGGRARRAGGRY